jgi:L-ascorbate metabolism protein UlaG (beta-lactamase superfamily)
MRQLDQDACREHMGAVSSLSGLRLERVKASSQFRDGAFRNTTRGATANLKGNPLPMLGEFAFGGRKRVPPKQIRAKDPRDDWRKAAPDSALRITWLGHSTMLIECDGVTILTDPVFGDRASPVGFAGPKRFADLPVSLAQLPKLDAILLSHNHYDHLCVTSQRFLASQRETPIITSLGVGADLEALGYAPSRITELDWLESHVIQGTSGCTLHITATPAQHFSGRGLLDRNATLWSSWVIEGKKRKVFFSGDTGLTEEFVNVGEKYGPFDVAMLEVGAWNPMWNDIHLGPAQALSAYQMLQAKTLLPVHWGTFDLALHAWDEPAETLLELAPKQGARVILPELGACIEPTEYPTAGPSTAWWREYARR